MGRWLRRFRRRPPVVLVDAATHQRLCELAVLGAAYEVIRQAELSWLLLDADPAEFGPWDD